VTIQAIETHYAGHRFRSRLEARWAVFLTALGIDWTYEPQGYVLGDGTPYLPDFLVRPGAGHEFWLEIKGQHPSRAEIDKAAQLAEGTQKDTYLYFGPMEQPGAGLSAMTSWDEYMEPATSRPRWRDEHGWILSGSEALRWQIGLLPTGYFFPAKPLGRPHRSAFLWWTECHHCGRTVIKHNGQIGWCPFWGDEAPDSWDISGPDFGHETPRLQAAYTAARSARFEHGETPA
jgi:hypothetical protein